MLLFHFIYFFIYFFSPQTESDLEATLPRSLDERANRLDKMLLDRLDAFIRSRTVQFSVPLGMGLFEGESRETRGITLKLQ